MYSNNIACTSRHLAQVNGTKKSPETKSKLISQKYFKYNFEKVELFSDEVVSFIDAISAKYKYRADYCPKLVKRTRRQHSCTETM